MKLNIKQGSDKWHTWRAGGIGGSDIGTILGVNPYKNYQRLLLERQKIVETPNLSNNPHVKRGVENESSIRNEVSLRHFTKFEPCCFQHDVHDFVRYSSDGVSQDGSLLVEIKCPQTLPDEFKTMHLAQCMWGMGASNAKKCLLVYQTVEGDMMELRIDFNPELFSHYVDEAGIFLKSVEENPIF